MIKVGGLNGVKNSRVNYNPSGRTSESGYPVSFGAEVSSLITSDREGDESEEVPSSKGLTVRFSTSDGRRGELYWGENILASVGGVGGTVNVKYHESSTEEDPVVTVWGVDSGGKGYEKVIHLNEVNPGYATPAEMIALNAHLHKTGYMDESETGPGALWAALGEGSDANSKMDFEQFYHDFIAMQRLGNNSKAALCQLELERYHFFFLQNQNPN